VSTAAHQWADACVENLPRVMIRVGLFPNQTVLAPRPPSTLRECGTGNGNWRMPSSTLLSSVKRASSCRSIFPCTSCQKAGCGKGTSWLRDHIAVWRRSNGNIFNGSCRPRRETESKQRKPSALAKPRFIGASANPLVTGNFRVARALCQHRAGTNTNEPSTPISGFFSFPESPRPADSCQHNCSHLPRLDIYQPMLRLARRRWAKSR